jgi:hypothetical protein
LSGDTNLAPVATRPVTHGVTAPGLTRNLAPALGFRAEQGHRALVGGGPRELGSRATVPMLPHLHEGSEVRRGGACSCCSSEAVTYSSTTFALATARLRERDAPELLANRARFGRSGRLALSTLGGREGEAAEVLPIDADLDATGRCYRRVLTGPLRRASSSGILPGGWDGSAALSLLGGSRMNSFSGAATRRSCGGRWPWRRCRRR